MATKLSDVIQRGTHAARPAASLAGIQYFETDTGLLLRDNGSSWDSMSLAALVTAKGDLLAGTGAGAVARLGVGTDGLPVVADSSQPSGLNYGGIIGGTAFAPSGLTGSVAASRYVGATASVAPTTGAHLLGDWVTTQDGKIWVCTTAGTPGTWTQVSGSGTFTGEVAGTDFAPTGLTGSTAASRYVGATASGAPASGAHLLGDFVIDQTGKVYVCTTAGTPGTWTQAGGGSLTTATALLGADVTITPTNTYVDGPSVSLAAGTWLITAYVSCVEGTTTNSYFNVRLWDGTTSVASTEVISLQASAPVSCTVAAVVTPGSTTTYKVSVANVGSAGSPKIKAATVHNASGNTATGIVAVKVA